MSASATAESSATTSATGSRERILEVATRLFVASGYRGLSMREIAAEVGMSKPAIYHYFNDKEDLFLAILDRYLDRMGEMLAAVFRERPSTRERIAAMVRGILEQPLEERAVQRLASSDLIHLSADARAAFYERYEEKFLGPIRNTIEEGIADGALRPFNSRVATWALLGMLYPYFRDSDGPAPSDAMIRQVTEIYLGGVGLPESES